MLVQLTKKLLVITGVSVALATTGFGQCKEQKKDPQWKDRAEYDLREAITKEADPAKQVDLLKQWKEKYPTSDFSLQRSQALLQTYAKMGKPKDVIATAKEMVAEDPCSIVGLYFLNFYTIANADNSPEALDTGDKAANGLLSNLDKIFADDKKPANVPAETWKKERGNQEALAHRTLGWVALQRKQNEVAEKEFTRVLELTPGDGQTSYWLGTAIIAQKNPQKQAQAIYEFARAAAYAGEGAMPEANRTGQIRPYVEKIYSTYHGDKSGLEDLMKLAATSALPPPDWKLKSIIDIQKEEAQKEEELAKSNPQLALWLRIKTGLTGGDADNFFNEMKGKALPEFEGTLKSTEPETKPKELVLSIGGTAPDITVKLDSPLAGKMEPGAKIKFKDAMAESYTKEPFMLTVTAEKDNISGWKPVGAAPAKKTGGAKKAPVRKKK